MTIWEIMLCQSFLKKLKKKNIKIKNSKILVMGLTFKLKIISKYS